MFETMMFLYVIIEFLIMVVGSFCLLTDEDIVNFEEILNNRYDFIKGVFSIQVYISTIVNKYNINLVGHVLLQLFVVVFAIPCNVLIFVILTVMLIGKVIIKLFCLLFQKKETSKNDV